MTKKTIAVLTSGRQDWGLLWPLCEAIRKKEGLELSLLVGGMALEQSFGATLQAILDAGFVPTAELPWDVMDASAAQQSAAALLAVSAALDCIRPDVLLLLGDRFETLAAAMAATLALIPVVHLYGGEETEGAFDNAMRHSLTKLAHMHLVSHREYAKRVIQMGEPEHLVHVVGALGVDNIIKRNLLSREQLSARLGVDLTQPIGLVTVHPETLAPDSGARVAHAVVEAMRQIDMTWIVTLPNSDPGQQLVREALQEFSGHKPHVYLFSALGEEIYLSLMRISAFVLGNSSSAFMEAPSLRVPSINVGDRQKGRIKALSVLDSKPDSASIVSQIQKAQSPHFRKQVSQQALPFGKGDAAQRIVRVIEKWTPTRPPIKSFADLDFIYGS